MMGCPVPPPAARPVIDPLFLGFGLGLVALGVGSGVRLRRQGDRDAAREDLRPFERTFRAARRRRRRKVAGLLIFCGVAIPTGDAVLVAAGPAAAGPWLSGLLLALLAACGGMVVLALVDSFATALHTRDQAADVTAGRAALEHELRRALAARAKREAAAAPERPVRNRLRDYSFDD